MKIFTYSQFRQKLATILDLARREGRVMIKRKDGSLFNLSPAKRNNTSPLDVRSLKTKITTADIINSVRESRQQ